MVWKTNYYMNKSEDDLIYDLLYATYSRDINKIDELMQHGIDPCSPTDDGTSPIHIASVMESPYGANIVFRMLSYGADPNIQTSTGLSPLHIASMWGRVETINILLDYGADVSLKDFDDMSALDFCETAEENRYECIDALTRYRPSNQRKSRSLSGRFLGKSRNNLNKIIGGKVAFSFGNKDITSDRYGGSENYYKNRNARAEEIYKLSARSNARFIRKSNFQPKNSVNVAIQTDFIEKCMSTLDIDVPDFIPNDNSFITCKQSLNEDRFCDFETCDVISSTLLEEPTLYNSALSVQLSEESSDSSETSSSSRSGSSRRSEPIKSTRTGTLSLQDEFSEYRGSNSSQQSNSIKSEPVEGHSSRENLKDRFKMRKRLCKSSEYNINVKNVMVKPRKNHSRLFLPISFPKHTKNKCNVNLNICISDNRDTQTAKDKVVNADCNTIPTINNKELSVPKLGKSNYIPHIIDDQVPEPVMSLKEVYALPELNGQFSNFVQSDASGDHTSHSKDSVVSKITELSNIVSPDSNFPHNRIPSVPEKKEINENTFIVLPNRNEEDKELEERGNSFEVQNITFYTADDRTVNDNDDLTSSEDYHNDKSVASLVEYYEEKHIKQNDISYKDIVHSKNDFEVSSERLLETPDLDEWDGVPTIPRIDFSQKPRGVLEELEDLPLEYNWKDVSRLGNVSMYSDTVVKIPGRLLTMHDDELRLKLEHVGINVGKITDTTRKIYQKHLAKLEMNSYLPLKPTDKYEDFTQEMAQMLFGTLELTEDTMEMLEKEMTLKFTHPEKHTWREGTMNTSFNYFLLDPRVTNNLPGRAEKMSFIERFRVFIGALFFVGRGKQCRPYEYLHEASRYVFRPPSDKINMIQEIWEAGYGVVCVHVFHGIIPVEAFTREACMIEAMGFPRLTNSKHGDVYGTAVSWSDKKRRLLGIWMLMKAMDIYLMEGEKQIRIQDLGK